MTPVPRLVLGLTMVPAISQWIKGSPFTNSCKKAAPLEAPMSLLLAMLLISAIAVFSFKALVFSGKIGSSQIFSCDFWAAWINCW